MHVVSAARARGVTSFPGLARSSPVQYEILRVRRGISYYDESARPGNEEYIKTSTRYWRNRKHEGRGCISHDFAYFKRSRYHVIL